MSDYKEQIGARIKAARILKGLTQDNLAEKLDVSTSCISRYETGVSIAWRCNTDSHLLRFSTLESNISYTIMYLNLLIQTP